MATWIGMLWGALGLVQLFSGLHRRWVGEHPSCGACEFDLTGLAEDALCPECGAGVPERSVGRRRRKPRRIVAGAVNLVLGTVVGVSTAVPGGPMSIVRPMAPLWVVRMEARGGSDGGLRELAQRVESGGLDASTVAEIAEEALVARREGHAWRALGWGRVVDSCLATRSLSPDLRRRCIEESVIVYWFGENGRQDHSTSVVFVPLVGPRSSISFDASITAAALDGHSLIVGTPITGRRGRHGPSPAPGDTWIEVRCPDGVTGATMTLTWLVRYVDAATGVEIGSAWEYTEVIDVGPRSGGTWEGRRDRVEERTGG